MNPNPPLGFNAKYAWTEVARVEPPKRAVTRRVADFEPAAGLYDAATAQAQAGRCVQCPHPNCVSACPLGTPIAELLALTADGNFREAAELFFTSHSIPELAAHTCVGGRRCERACVIGSKSDPVPIRSITRFLLDYGWNNGLAEPLPAPATGRSVAVIGSGICGLVAADILSRRGHAVTVLDSRREPGGRAMNGLPGFRVDTALVARRVESLKTRGVRFRMQVRFGEDVTLNDLARQFDAVLLAFGRADPVGLDIPGIHLQGISQAFAFLSSETAGHRLDVRGRRVVVIGGGDTAMDALRAAIRRGAADAVCVYRRDLDDLPADAEEYANAVEEGARFEFLSQPVALIGNFAGAVVALRCVRTELGGPDSDGRRTVHAVAGSEFEIPADVVLVALGFKAPRLPAGDDFASLTLDERGHPELDADGMTNLPGVFAGGAIVRSPAPLSDVVRDARAVAAAIDRYLAASVKYPGSAGC